MRPVSRKEMRERIKNTVPTVPQCTCHVGAIDPTCFYMQKEAPKSVPYLSGLSEVKQVESLPEPLERQ